MQCKKTLNCFINHHGVDSDGVFETIVEACDMLSSVASFIETWCGFFSDPHLSEEKKDCLLEHHKKAIDEIGDPKKI